MRILSMFSSSFFSLFRTGFLPSLPTLHPSTALLRRNFVTEAKLHNGYYIMKGKTGYFVTKPSNPSDPPPILPKSMDNIKETKLVLNGIGYKCNIVDNRLIFELGFSHKIAIRIPDTLDVKVFKSTLIYIRGYDYQNVRDLGATIRRLRPLEPYKGKGIRFTEEEVILKKRRK
eukprot:Sdes_comp23184_c0_seq1m21484